MAGMPKERPAPGRRPAGLLGQDQLVVAGVAQAVALAAVPDQHFAPALQQAGTVQLVLACGGPGLATGGLVLQMGGRLDVVVRRAGKHRRFHDVGKCDVNDYHLTVNRQSGPAEGTRYAARRSICAGRRIGIGMGDVVKGPSRIIGELLARPDQLTLEMGAGGELLVARVRAIGCAIALLLPLLALLTGSSVTEVMIGLVAAVVVNVVAQVWLYLAGIGSLVVWCFYVIAIVFTALRHNGRLTLYIGALAILQYALVVWAVFALTPDAMLVSIDYGTASMGGQVQRLVLLLIVTLVTAMIVYRMQRLVEMSGRDGLTGLPNRAWLLQSMPRILEATRTGGTSLTLALLDLDGFRRINDEAGHQGGDRAIRQEI